MRESRDMKRASRIMFAVFFAIILVYVVYFLPLPLYIFKPGTAEVIGPMVQVKQGEPDEKGEFMLTTVQVQDASIFGYLMSFIQPYRELHLKSELLRKNETEAEYSQRQETVMRTSQADAIQTVYKKLGIPYHISKDGVIIQSVEEGLPAHDVFQPGDYVLKVGDKAIASSQDVRAAIEGKRAGETVHVSYKRGKVTHESDVALGTLPPAGGKAAEPGEARAGLGIVLTEITSIKSDADGNQVNIQAGEIGGPSAGLMFSLEIYDRLTPGDLAKGYKIAGTGEIDTEGNVGVIGGIKHKIVAADRAGAEIFFSPKDTKLEDGRTIANYTDAKQRAGEIGTKMKVVPVGTLQEALDYLAALSAKSGG